MARIKINDLPQSMKVSREELKKVTGGLTMISSSYTTYLSPIRSIQRLPLSPIAWPSTQEASGCGCMGMAQDPAECMMEPG